MTQGSQQKALSSSGAVQHGSVAPVLVESSFDESCWLGNDGVFEGLGGSQDLGTSSRTRPRKYFECAVWGGDVHGAAGCLGEAVE